MDIDRLREYVENEDNEVKSYRHLCELLDIKPKGGNAKVAQIKEIERHIKYSRKGYRIIIEDIFEEPSIHPHRSYPDDFYIEKSLFYMVTNQITDRKYIGITSITLAAFISRHKNEHINKSHKLYDWELFKDYRRYGFDKFKWEILEFFEEGDLNKRKSRKLELIEKYNSMQHGYNKTLNSGWGRRKD